MAQETSLTATSPGPSFLLPRRFPPVVCFLLVLELGVIVIQLWCTCHPPNEQLLVGMVVGALSSIVRCSCGGGHVGSQSRSSLLWGPGARSSLSSVPAVIHLPYPTCKQVLAVVGMGGGSALSRWGLVEHVSVTWCAYRGCWVLTGRVSPFWDLLASLCTLLPRVNSLHPI
jgi:hypothetical protein